MWVGEVRPFTRVSRFSVLARRGPPKILFSAPSPFGILLFLDPGIRPPPSLFHVSLCGPLGSPSLFLTLSALFDSVCVPALPSGCRTFPAALRPAVQRLRRL